MSNDWHADREQRADARIARERAAEPARRTAAAEEAAARRTALAEETAVRRAIDMQVVDQRIAVAIEARATVTSEAVGQALAQALQIQRDALTKEFDGKIAELKLDMVNRMMATLDSITKGLELGREKPTKFVREDAQGVIDLPNPLPPRSAVN
jgi:hypothetical protein